MSEGISVLESEKAADALPIRKPVMRQQLSNGVRDLLAGRPHRAIPPAVTNSPMLAQNRPRTSVLVAEDNPMNQRVARRLLERLDCTVSIAVDGREALARLEGTRFDLLFVDCHMPDVDGYEVARIVRERENDRAGDEARLPIVAVTANVIGDNLARCKEAGTDDFLSKPYGLDEVRTILDRWSPPDGTLPDGQLVPIATVR